MQPAYRCPCLLNFLKELLPQVHVAHRPPRTLPVVASPFAGFARGSHMPGEGGGCGRRDWQKMRENA